MKNKLFKIAALAMIPASASTFAADEQLSGTFSTIKNVTISQTTAMIINGLQPASGSACQLTTPAAGTAFPGETVMKMANTGATFPLNPGTTSGDMVAGGSCSTAINGVVGIYEIDGAEGALVDITLATTAAIGGLTFDAVGCASDYDGGADGDLCAAVGANTTTIGIQLAATGDLTVSAGQGTPEIGKSVLALGGTVTSSIGLTAAQAYTVPFEVVVAY
jgi:hypothetical protein